MKEKFKYYILGSLVLGSVFLEKDSYNVQKEAEFFEKLLLKLSSLELESIQESFKSNFAIQNGTKTVNNYEALDKYIK